MDFDGRQVFGNEFRVLVNSVITYRSNDPTKIDGKFDQEFFEHILFEGAYLECKKHAENFIKLLDSFGISNYMIGTNRPAVKYSIKADDKFAKLRPSDKPGYTYVNTDITIGIVYCDPSNPYEIESDYYSGPLYISIPYKIVS